LLDSLLQETTMNAFTIGKVVEFIKNQEWDGCQKFSAEDIKSSNVQSINQVYYNYLLEFGFSRDLLCTDVARFDILQDLDHPEIFKDLIPRLTLQAGVSWLLKSLECEISFDFKDLAKPDPKRTLVFFSVLQNFWVFVISNKEKDEEIEKKVDNLAQKKLVLQKTIGKYKSELARIKEQEVLERAEAEVYREKIQHVDAAIEEKSGGLQLLKEQLKKLNPIVVHLQELYEAAVQKEGEVEKEIRSINVIQQLDNELQVEQTGLQGLQYEKISLKRSLEDIQTSLDQYQAILALAEAVKEEFDRVNVKGRMQTIIGEEKELMRQEEEDERRIQEIEVQISNFKTTLSTLQLKWNRRREGKENETRELNKKVESSSQSCSQSKLEAINRARELDISIAHVNTQLQDLEKLLRSQYAGVLGSMETFNEALRAEFDHLKFQ